VALAGYPALLSIGGTSTVLSNEAMTALSAGLVYQITAAAHQALDPSVSPVVQVSPDGSSWGAPTGTYTIDFTSGVVTFASSQGGTEQCRIQSGNYIPLLLVAQARKCSWAMKRDLGEATIFSSTGPKAKVPLLIDASGTLEDLTPFREDLNTIAYDGVHRWFDDLFLPGADVFLAFQPGGAGNQTGRAWVKLESLDEALDVTDVVVGTVGWQLNSRLTSVPAAATGTAHVSWR